MKPQDYLNEAEAIITQRSGEYGGVENCFDRIAAIASLVLAKEVSARDVAMILHCTKLGRLAENPIHHDSYVDGINYLAFGALFAERDLRPVPAMTNPAAPPAPAPSFGSLVASRVEQELTI